MRPVELRLRAFGSFAGSEVVDFEALSARGLFVVSGDTGTGKTTIFDAMSWALYGVMPQKQPTEVRSHHVAPEVRTEVGFTFDCDGQRYAVTRSPAQQRPAKRGSGTVEEPAAAHLVRIDDDAATPLATRPSDVSRVCAELIGLGPEQFRRVILLPQGEFSRFLLADSRDREPLISRLFGGEVYEHVIEQLKQERAVARERMGGRDRDLVEQLNAARTHLGHARKALGTEPPHGPDQADEADGRDEVDEVAGPETPDRDRIAVLLADLDAPLAALREEVQGLHVRATEAVAAHQRATEAATRFDDATRLRRELQELDDEHDAIVAGRDAAERSALARPVVVAADELEAKRAAAQRSAAERDRRRGDLGVAFEALGVDVDVSSATAVTHALAEHRRLLEGDRAAIGALRDAHDAAEAAATTRREVTEQLDVTTLERRSVVERIDELDGREPDLRRLALDPATIDDEIGRVTDRIEQHRRLLDLVSGHADAAGGARRAAERYDTAFAAFVSTEAPRLAAGLRTGAPCPVCGSTEHPAPADPGRLPPTTYEQVERAAADRAAANATLAEHEALMAELRSALGEQADVTVEELEVQRHALEQRRSAAVVAGEELRQLLAAREQAAAQVTDADTRLAVLQERGTTAAEDLRRRTEDLTRAREAAAGVDVERLERRAEALDRIDGLVEGLERCFTRAASDVDLAAAAAGALADSSEDTPFDTADEARAVLLDTAEEERHLEAARRHDEQRITTRAALDTLTLQGIPAERPSMERTEADAAAATRRHDERLAVHRTVGDAATYATDALAHHDRLLADSAGVRCRAELLERVVTVCTDGGPGVEMSLKRWVLTRELDRVTDAANVHLGRMTGQRYTLRRPDRRDDGRRSFGLGLEVFDVETGRARSTSSLSGGEQFQASLALALGLADVVSHGGTAGGHRFEALFVDEGFGSLSTRSLDDAIETLHQLHASGRMVGAITHVDAMKQQLHVGIEVLRRADGAGSTLKVHP